MSAAKVSVKKEPCVNNNSFSSYVTEDQLDEYTCHICETILETPTKPAGCKHVFCKQCLFNAYSMNPTCPMCRAPYEFKKAQPCMNLDKEIKSRTYRCPKCQETMLLRNFNAHRMHCSDYSVTAPKPTVSSSVTAKPSLNNMFSSLNVSTQSVNSDASSNLSSFSSASHLAAKNPMKNGNARDNVPNRYTFKCPYCPQANMVLNDLRDHCNNLHANGKLDVVCPVCVAMPWGDPNQRSIDFIQHLNLRHRFEYDRFVDFSRDEDVVLKDVLRYSMQVV